MRIFCCYWLRKITTLSSTKLWTIKVFKVLYFDDTSTRTTRDNKKLEYLEIYLKSGSLFVRWLCSKLIHEPVTFSFFFEPVTFIQRILPILSVYIFTPEKYGIKFEFVTFKFLLISNPVVFHNIPSFLYLLIIYKMIFKICFTRGHWTQRVTGNDYSSWCTGG